MAGSARNTAMALIDLRPKAITAFGMIEVAAKEGEPLTHDGLKVKLGYASKGPVYPLIRDLLEAAVIRVDKRQWPFRFVPVLRTGAREGASA